MRSEVSGLVAAFFFNQDLWSWIAAILQEHMPGIITQLLHTLRSSYLSGFMVAAPVLPMWAGVHGSGAAHAHAWRSTWEDVSLLCSRCHATLTPVGFEPTQLALVELESTPLDHSGKVSLTPFRTTGLDCPATSIRCLSCACCGHDF